MRRFRLNRNIARNNIFVSGILCFGVKVSAELSNILPLVPYKLSSVPVSIVQCPKIFCQISQVRKFSGILDPPVMTALMVLVCIST